MLFRYVMSILNFWSITRDPLYSRTGLKTKRLHITKSVLDPFSSLFENLFVLLVFGGVLVAGSFTIWVVNLTATVIPNCIRV